MPEKAKAPETGSLPLVEYGVHWSGENGRELQRNGDRVVTGVILSPGLVRVAIDAFDFLKLELHGACGRPATLETKTVWEDIRRGCWRVSCSPSSFASWWANFREAP